MRYAIISLPPEYQNNNFTPEYLHFMGDVFQTNTLDSDVYFCRSKDEQSRVAHVLATQHPGVMFAKVEISSISVTAPGEVSNMELTDKGLLPF